ncbi:sensor histidine kinase [Microbacterium sp. NPDC055903]
MSARLRLTLSYVAVVVISGLLLLAVVAVYLLRYVPDGPISAQRFVPNRGDLIRAFLPPAAAAMFFLLVLGVVGGWWLAGRMLAPLSRIGRVADAVSKGSLSQRVSLEGPKDEFTELADVFDSMLDRLEAQLAEEKRFAANASHELRTPLAITQVMLDVARSDPDRNVDAVLARLQEVNTRAIELTEALLQLSRAERGFSRSQVDLSLAAEEAVETLVPLADRRGVRMDVGGDEIAVVGSAALLQQLVTNLVHNAIVHNVAEGLVAVRTRAQPGAVALVVENSGPVLSGELIETLTEPFQRGAARTRDDDHVGVGLGLAIARRIAEAHDGSLVLSPREGGGLIATVWLPRTGG